MTAAPTSRPRLLVVAGPNGAGKTTITERGLAHEWFHDCEYVNPDTIAQDELGDWNDPAIVLRAIDGFKVQGVGKPAGYEHLPIWQQGRVRRRPQHGHVAGGRECPRSWGG